MPAPKETPKKKAKIVKVPLPDFFIAMVLPDAHAHRQPDPSEVTALKEKTSEFWTKWLKNEAFPKKFKSLELEIEKTQFGTVVEEHQDIELARDLDTKYNMYVEFSGKVSFKSTGSGVPTGNEAFAEMTAAESLDYLVKFVRELNKECVFANAIEVCARRLVIDPMADGGNVRAPTFFFAFATEPWEDESPKPAPSDEEVEIFRQKTYDRIDKNLKKEYPDSYEGSEMKVLMHEAGTSKPDDRFDVYIENDFKASFSKDPPTSAELFNVIMRCGGTDSTEYLKSMQKIKKSQFEDVTTVTVQIVGLEMQDVEELPEAPPPDEQSNDEDPDEEDEEHDLSIKIPIFLAVCTNADRPSEEEVEQFDDLMVRFFYTEMKKEYPDQLKNLSLHKLYTKHDQGIPEPRFNMCSEWYADITFRPDSDPPNERELTLFVFESNMSTILAYVRKLGTDGFKESTEVTMRRDSQKPGADDPIHDADFQAAIDLPPTPVLLAPPPEDDRKKKEEEERKRREAEEKAAAEEAARRKAEEDRLREEEEEAARRKAEEDRLREEEEARRKAEEKEARRRAEEQERARQAAAAKAAEEERQKREEEAKAAAEEDAKKRAREERLKKAAEAKAAKLEAEAKRKKEKKEKKKKKVPPPVDDGYESPVDDLPKVKTSDVFVALRLDGATSPPTPEEMEQLRKNTEAYFTSRLKTKYPTFARLRVKVGVMEWDKGFPKPEFNFYCEWDCQASFQDLSNPSSPMKTVAGTRQREVTVDQTGGDDGTPTSYELMRSLVVGANIIKYLTDSVRVVGGTFANGTAVFIRQRAS
ncbi:MAG: hypothetical protein SGILL_005870 [Bacillariaceae sp.]